jgi:hypothetical protein
MGPRIWKRCAPADETFPAWIEAIFPGCIIVMLVAMVMLAVPLAVSLHEGYVLIIP